MLFEWHRDAHAHFSAACKNTMLWHQNAEVQIMLGHYGTSLQNSPSTKYISEVE